MDLAGKAVRIRLRDLRSPQMRAFHMSWIAFHLCFFGWFGIAPLMAAVRDDLALTQAQIGNTIIASVAVTIVARLVIGWLCDRIGPRKAYAWLLMIGSIPVATIGLADSYETFLGFRLAIGAIGASFVITQYHTSLMFAPNCVGTANATTAGWGNLGGGTTQILMPLILAALAHLGVNSAYGWRVAMIIPGITLFGMGLAYAALTQDTPAGNFDELRKAGELPEADSSGSFRAALRDYRVWALFFVYAACFGVELTIHNIAALHFYDSFDLSIASAGLIAGLFGMMNLFARTLGGALGDRAGIAWGLRGRAGVLGLVLLLEGIALMVFSQMDSLGLAIVTLVVFSLFVQAAEGATFALVPFVNRRALGSVAGIVGAGGNAGAVAAGFLFRGGITTASALLYLGAAVTLTSTMAVVLRFSPEDERNAAAEIKRSLDARAA